MTLFCSLCGELLDCDLADADGAELMHLECLYDECRESRERAGGDESLK